MPDFFGIGSAAPFSGRHRHLEPNCRSVSVGVERVNRLQNSEVLQARIDKKLIRPYYVQVPCLNNLEKVLVRKE